MTSHENALYCLYFIYIFIYLFIYSSICIIPQFKTLEESGVCKPSSIGVKEILKIYYVFILQFVATNDETAFDSLESSACPSSEEEILVDELNPADFSDQTVDEDADNELAHHEQNEVSR